MHISNYTVNPLWKSNFSFVDWYCSINRVTRRQLPPCRGSETNPTMQEHPVLRWECVSIVQLLAFTSLPSPSHNAERKSIPQIRVNFLQHILEGNSCCLTLWEISQAFCLEWKLGGCRRDWDLWQEKEWQWGKSEADRVVVRVIDRSGLDEVGLYRKKYPIYNIKKENMSNKQRKPEVCWEKRGG